MPALLTTSRYLLIGLIVLVILGLGGWYFFLRAQGNSLAVIDAGRGTGDTAPSFGDSTGSTYENIVRSQTNTQEAAQNTPTETMLPRLTQVNKTPVAGAGFVGAGTSSKLRFMERGSGYVFDVDPRTGILLRLTKTLIPRIYSAVIAPSGKVALQTLDSGGEILTSIGTVVPSLFATSSVGTLSQKPLRKGVQSISFGPTGEKIFYLAATQSADETIGAVATIDGTKPQELFESAIRGWTTTWLSDDRIIIVQNPASGSEGYAYEIKKGGALSPILRAVTGLMIVPRPSSPEILFSSVAAGAPVLMAQLNKTSAPFTIPLATFADKCVWAPGKQPVAYCAVPQEADASYSLDARLRGIAHSSDAWWRVEVSSQKVTLLYSPGSVSFDVENPHIDSAGEYIVFMNAADKSVWQLRVNE